MAGFEVIVRPVVFPNIRPAPARALAPEDKPDQGIAVISGSGGRSIDLPHTFSASASSQKPQKETRRQFDKQRVYQKDKDGKINKNNYVDIEFLKRVRLNADDAPIKVLYAEPPPADNVETLQSDVTRDAE